MKIKPKYIAGIMKAAAKRQMEFEKMQERKIHKERQEEGDLWSDKEVFVTTAYRKKMEERQLIEEEERRQEQIEALLDVRKQKDLSGFYSNLLKMKTGEMHIEEESEKERRLLSEKSKEKVTFESSDSKTKNKQYRSKRESSDEDELEENEQTAPGKEAEQIDETEKSADLEAEEPDAKKSKLETNIIEKPKAEIEVKVIEPKLTKEQKRELLFKKRTVDSKFDQELLDYFTRKSSHLSLKSYVERE
jgi:coiled-coil domain-containing protein 55